MSEHKIGTREEWQAAREELAKLEAEQAQRNEAVKTKRLELPWVPVEKEYVFDTEDGKKTLVELFDGRSQLLAYNIMYGPEYEIGACPGCSNLGDGLDGGLIHLNHRDVTLICFSRAPIERLSAYRKRMGWQFEYVSTYNSDFAFDFGLALTEEQAQQVPEVKEMIENPPEWLVAWSRQIGAELKDGLREAPTWIAFARENGTVYHTYTVQAPIRSSRRSSSSCSNGRRSGNPTSRVPGAKTNTPTDREPALCPKSHDDPPLGRGCRRLGGDRRADARDGLRPRHGPRRARLVPRDLGDDDHRDDAALGGSCGRTRRSSGPTRAGPHGALCRRVPRDLDGVRARRLRGLPPRDLTVPARSHGTSSARTSPAR